MNGIILAGGRSSRFGENKAFVKIEERSLIERTVSLLYQIFPKVYIVTNSPFDYPYLGVEIVVDHFKNCGPMGGIHAGLIASSSYHNFVTACDIPFLNTRLIRYLQQEASDFDVVVPKFGGKLQMLHAFYSKNCIQAVERRIKRGNLQLRSLTETVNPKIIEEEEIKRFDTLGQSFVNINTREDYKKVEALVS